LPLELFDPPDEAVDQRISRPQFLLEILDVWLCCLSKYRHCRTQNRTNAEQNQLAPAAQGRLDTSCSH